MEATQATTQMLSQDFLLVNTALASKQNSASDLLRLLTAQHLPKNQYHSRL
jgi:hypothetical protein